MRIRAAASRPGFFLVRGNKATDSCTTLLGGQSINKMGHVVARNKRKSIFLLKAPSRVGCIFIPSVRCRKAIT